RVATLEAHVGEFAAIRAPRRGQQRFGRTHDGLWVVAIRIGDHQRVPHRIAATAGGDVGDTGPERAAHAGDLLVDGIGHLVGDIAHSIAARGHRQVKHALALGQVVQLVFHAIGVRAGIQYAADHDVVLLQRAPGRELDVAAAYRLFDDLRFGEGAELVGT